MKFETWATDDPEMRLFRAEDEDRIRAALAEGHRQLLRGLWRVFRGPLGLGYHRSRFLGVAGRYVVPRPPRVGDSRQAFRHPDLRVLPLPHHDEATSLKQSRDVGGAPLEDLPREFRLPQQFRVLCHFSGEVKEEETRAGKRDRTAPHG